MALTLPLPLSFSESYDDLVSASISAQSTHGNTETFLFPPYAKCNNNNNNLTAQDEVDSDDSRCISESDLSLGYMVGGGGGYGSFISFDGSHRDMIVASSSMDGLFGGFTLTNHASIEEVEAFENSLAQLESSPLDQDRVSIWIESQSIYSDTSSEFPNLGLGKTRYNIDTVSVAEDDDSHSSPETSIDSLFEVIPWAMHIEPFIMFPPLAGSQELINPI